MNTSETGEKTKLQSTPNLSTCRLSEGVSRHLLHSEAPMYHSTSIGKDKSKYSLNKNVYFVYICCINLTYCTTQSVFVDS